MLGWRERDLQNAYLPFVLGEGLANYFSDPVFQQRVGGDPRSNPARAIEYFLRIFSDASRTWDDFGRLCRSTRLPVLRQRACSIPMTLARRSTTGPPA